MIISYNISALSSIPKDSEGCFERMKGNKERCLTKIINTKEQLKILEVVDAINKVDWLNKPLYWVFVTLYYQCIQVNVSRIPYSRASFFFPFFFHAEPKTL